MNALASLFNLAGPDLFIIAGIVLLLFGAKKLPELARGMGQAVREFSKAKDEFEREVTRPQTTEVVKLDEPKHETHTVLTEEPQTRDINAAATPKAEVSHDRREPQV